MTKILKAVQVVGVLFIGLGFGGVILRSVGLSAFMLPGILLFAAARLVLWFRNDSAP
ncbi:MAG: hypothetical protein KAX84_07690 [Burkholderiales bacterium]|nr:hypothetical protein [Burkholderiales bacterium]